MDEKVLIKSEIDQQGKMRLSILPICFIVVAVIIFIALLFPVSEGSIFSYWGAEYFGGGYVVAFDECSLLLYVFIIACLLLVVGIILLVMYRANSQCELCITEDNVKGKTLFGKEVVLPLSMVSSYATEEHLSTISIATSSGITKFVLIKNYKEMSQVLSELISKKQKGTESAATANQPSGNSLDDIVKLKSLLDAGIITREEFDAKKKQLLDL